LAGSSARRSQLENFSLGGVLLYTDTTSAACAIMAHCNAAATSEQEHTCSTTDYTEMEWELSGPSCFLSNARRKATEVGGGMRRRRMSRSAVEGFVERRLDAQVVESNGTSSISKSGHSIAILAPSPLLLLG